MNNNMYSRAQAQHAALPSSMPDISTRSPGSIDLSVDTMEMGTKLRMDTMSRPSNNMPMPWGLLNFYNENNAPWDPMGITRTQSQRGPHVNPSDVQRRANPSFNGWRSAQPSECGTVPPHGQAYSQCLPSDSGYESRKPDDTSVYGDVERNYDTQSVSDHLIGHQFFIPSGNAFPRDSWNQAPPTPVPASQNGPSDTKLICPECHAPCRTKSELNKHNQRHRKAWTCDVSGCSRKEGFGTQNDLERHKNSVHPETCAGPRYRCNIGACLTKDKDWPRADNFRQHLKRVHNRTVSADQDLGEYALPTPPKPEEQARQNVAQELAGVGSEAFTTLAWEELPGEVQLSPPEQDMEMDLLVDPSLTSVGDPMSNVLNASPMASAVPNGQLPEQGSNQNLENHSQPSYGSIQSHREFVQPGEISRPASARTVAVGRTESRPNGPRAIQSQASIPVSDQVSQSQDSAIGDMKCDSPQKDPSAPESSEPIARNQSSSKMVSQDRATGQSPSLSFSSGDLSEQAMFKFLSKIPKNFIQSFLNGNAAEEVAQKPSPAPNNSAEATHPCPHQDCRKSFNRRCELKKHLKRHEKPYGCTYAACKKKFGSKNDWKRHENSQHFQLEVWKCTENRTEDDGNTNTNNSQQDGTCGKVCHRRETFRTHLQKEHKMENAAQVDQSLEKCRVGRNCDSRFWCGFCVEVIEITKKGTAAWTERFNHIDDHYTGRNGAVKMDSSQWKHVDPDLPEVDLGGSPDDSSDAESADEAPTVAAVPNVSRKRAAEDSADDEPNAKRVGTQTSRWLCCKCNMDADAKLHGGCVSCTHLRCEGCEEYPTWVSADKHASRPSTT